MWPYSCQGVFLNTVARRFEQMPQQTVNDSDCSLVGSLRCKTAAFKAENGPTSAKQTCISPSRVTDDTSSWAHFSPMTLSMKQLPLLRALQMVPMAEWKVLWLGAIMRAGMVLSSGDVLHLVLLATPSLSFTVRLVCEEALGGHCIDKDSLWQELPITSLDGIRLHEYSISLSDGLDLVFLIDEGQQPLDFMLRHTVQTHSSTWLRKVHEGMADKCGDGGGVGWLWWPLRRRIVCCIPSAGLCAEGCGAPSPCELCTDRCSVVGRQLAVGRREGVDISDSSIYNGEAGSPKEGCRKRWSRRTSGGG